MNDVWCDNQYYALERMDRKIASRREKVESICDFIDCGDLKKSSWCEANLKALNSMKYNLLKNEKRIDSICTSNIEPRQELDKWFFL